VALFGKKKSKTPEEPTPPETAAGNGGSDGGGTGDSEDMGGFVAQPEKARKWFAHARTAADSSNYEYAIWCFANGLRFDPEDMTAHQEMYEAAVKLRGRGGKPASSREIRKLESKHPVDRFAAAEFAWMRNLTSAPLALKLIEATVKAQQNEFGRWLAPILLNLLRQQKKPSKSDFVTAMHAFGEVGAWDQAIQAGEIASQLDPTDGALAAEIKNLSAQRAMDQGGYEEAGGAEGGFRKFVRDSDRQREIEEMESLSGAGTSEERNLLRAKKEYEENPLNPEAIQRYAQLLRKPGTPEAEEEAYQVYMKGFKDTKEYRFRMAAGDIRIAQAERNVRDLEEKLKASPDDESLKEQLEAARRDMLMYKASEFAEREEQYPTDRQVKMQRGEVEYQLGNYENAMACFQTSKDEPKLRVRSGHRLGQCFAAEGWHQEAEQEFKEALENIDATTKGRELDIRYDLMVSLIERAKEENSIDLAKEALEICSSIARRDITFRDIRVRRKEIDGLIKELSGSPSS